VSFDGLPLCLQLMEKHPTTVVVAAKSKEVALNVQQLFLSLDFRVYLSDDYIGVEVGGALKNVVAGSNPGLPPGLIDAQSDFTLGHFCSCERYCSRSWIRHKLNGSCCDSRMR
jgi:hypothetical protein